MNCPRMAIALPVITAMRIPGLRRHLKDLGGEGQDQAEHNGENAKNGNS